MQRFSFYAALINFNVKITKTHTKTPGKLKYESEKLKKQTCYKPKTNDNVEKLR